MSEDFERLVRLETKLDVVLDNHISFRSSFEKHDERLKRLENTRSHMIGFAAAIGALAGYIIDGIKHSMIPR
jgi:hypothetical protein